VKKAAFAEGKTRAQVYVELIKVQQDGLRYVIDMPHPEVNPLFMRQVAALKPRHWPRR